MNLAISTPKFVTYELSDVMRYKYNFILINKPPPQQIARSKVKVKQKFDVLIRIIFHTSQGVNIHIQDYHKFGRLYLVAI